MKNLLVLLQKGMDFLRRSGGEEVFQSFLRDWAMKNLEHSLRDYKEFGDSSSPVVRAWAARELDYDLTVVARL